MDSDPQKTGIICLACTGWNFMYQRPQQLMNLLSRDFRIGYINPPITVRQGLPLDKVLAGHTHSINPNLIILQPLIPRGETRNKGRQYFVELLKRFISGFGFRNIILWINLPQFGYLCGNLGEKLVLYDCLDDYASFSWTTDETAQSDRLLTAKADVVLTVSETLRKNKKTINPCCFLVPNGCDFEHFHRATGKMGIPTDILKINRPRIGFIGAIYEWIDFKLIRALAEREPNWSMVLVGPVQRNIHPPLLTNIYYLGRKRYNILPNYIRQFDVCTIPFDLSSEAAINSCPIKLYEYMATGKPVVSTNIPAVTQFKRIVEIANDSEQFHSNIGKLLRETETEARHRQEKQINVAGANTWLARYRTIKYILKKFM